MGTIIDTAGLYKSYPGLRCLPEVDVSSGSCLVVTLKICRSGPQTPSHQMRERLSGIADAAAWIWWSEHTEPSLPSGSAARRADWPTSSLCWIRHYAEAGAEGHWWL